MNEERWKGLTDDLFRNAVSCLIDRIQETSGGAAMAMIQYIASLPGGEALALEVPPGGYLTEGDFEAMQRLHLAIRDKGDIERVAQAILLYLNPDEDEDEEDDEELARV